MLEALPTDSAMNVLSFLHHLPDLAYIRDLKGRVIYTNHALADYLEAASGDDTSWLFEQPCLRTIEASVVQSGHTAQMTLELAQDTALSQFLVRCMPWERADGTLQGTIAVLTDVTAAHEKEQAAAELNNLLISVIEHMPVRVFWKDPTLVYLGCNTLFANDMGFDTPEQLIGHDDYHTNMTQAEADICRSADFDVYRSGQGRFGLEEVVQTDEGKSWIRVSKVPLHNVDGEKIGVLGMYEDIGTQKRAQIELESALRREQELNELKTRFISTVSHEFRNPLSTILTSAEMLIHLGERMTPAMRDKRLNNIVRAVGRMTRLMENTLYIGREDIHEARKNYVAVNFVELCADVINQLEEAGEANGRINMTTIGDAAPIIGVPLHLSQIVQNLLINALKYSDDAVNMTLTWRDEDVELSVQDFGVGIPDDEQALVYDSFFRSSNAGERSGSGLGLFIVKRAVELHHGNIMLSSELSQGTTFTVTLPQRRSTIEVS